MASQSEQYIVEVQQLTKSYQDKTVVDGINFNIHEGECLGILGPNGAGKTTTLRMLLGLAQPDSGSISVLGLNLPEQASKMREKVGVVPQMDNLDVDFSVVENLRTYASYFGIDKHSIEERINELIEFASLGEKRHARVTALSGGMQRRLTLARSLINNPKILVLDEPTTGLDPQARQMIWHKLRTLLKTGRTLILTTHYMEEAERLCDRLILMDYGKILAIGTPAELIKTHIEPQVIEVHGNDISKWVELCHTLPIARHEVVGETVFCYCDNEKPVLEVLYEYSDLEYLHRRANLEDVFMKLTGRELRDG